MNYLTRIWKTKASGSSDVVSSNETVNTQKFGTFLGVFVPSILMLFGVIIFLRLGLIVGQTGIFTAVVIMTFAALIVLITCLSMAAIATNIEVGKGGVYYILSRSLGIEAGSAIGIPLFLKQSLTIAFCVIGFAESIHDLIPSWPIQTVGLWTLATLTLLAYTSIKGALKVQVFIFLTIIASLVSFFSGSGPVEPIDPSQAISSSLPSLGFWAVFALFFPAMTGVESSVSLSGDLKNPSRSLPIGTVGAIIVGYLVYVSMAIVLANRVPLERLASDPLIIQDISRLPSLIIVGIWGATLSSALGGLLGAPRTLQAIANDGIAPRFFGKTYGSMQEPRIATLATCSVAFIATYFGSINFIAPMLTMISLICYGVLNLSAGIETLMANPSWRPRFNVHWSISLGGALACFIVMLMITPGYSMISLFMVGLIYTVVRKRQVQTSWEDIRHGILHLIARFAIYRMASVENSLKSWRPHFLVFTKYSEPHSSALMRFSEAISQNKSFLTLASILPMDTTSNDHTDLSIKSVNNKHIRTFFHVKRAASITSGMKQIIENYGLGPLSPNTIVFGGMKKEDQSSSFIEVLQTAIRRHSNVVIINDENKIQLSAPSASKEIHLWWDDANRNNSELMLILASMLQKSPDWKKARVCVKAIVTSEFEKQAKIEQFQKISFEKRLPINIEVLVLNDSGDTFNFVKEFSKDAATVLHSLNSPPKNNEPTAEYLTYLNQASDALKSLPSLAFVLSSDQTPLESILK